MLEFLIKFLVLWFSISIVTLATAWYGYVVIRPRWPDWWRQIVADNITRFMDQ